jgi:lipopolysaccharide transport system permease protein
MTTEQLEVEETLVTQASKPVERGMTRRNVGKPHMVIRPPGRWAPLAVGELFQYGDLFVALAVRDVKLRYKQTALGVIWVILQPMLAAGIFSFVFGTVAKLPSDGFPYFVFSYASLLGWNAFNGTLTKASSCVVANSSLVSKVFFPRLILPLSCVLLTLIDFAVAATVMVALMFIYHIVPGWGILLLPIWLTLLILLAVGVGLYTSALMVSYRDLGYAIPVLLQFLLYASPVAYAASSVPERFRTLYFLNPISDLLEAMRWSILGRGELSWGWIVYSFGVVVASFVLGAFAFKRMERKFVDVI